MSNYKSRGFTEVDVLPKGDLRIYHGGNMGNSINSVRENVDKMFYSGVFDKLLTKGHYFVDKHGDCHNDPSYSWCFIVPKGKWEDLVSF